MKGLSRRCQAILDCIRDKILTVGYAPSIREIGEVVGLSSSSTVHTHLKTLEQRDYIRRDPSKPRSIQLLDKALPQRATLQQLLRVAYEAHGELQLGGLGRSEKVAAFAGDSWRQQAEQALGIA